MASWTPFIMIVEVETKVEMQRKFLSSFQTPNHMTSFVCFSQTRTLDHESSRQGRRRRLDHDKTKVCYLFFSCNYEDIASLLTAQQPPTSSLLALPMTAQWPPIRFFFLITPPCFNAADSLSYRNTSWMRIPLLSLASSFGELCEWVTVSAYMRDN